MSTMKAKNHSIRVSWWDPQYREDFVRLNEAWIEKYFQLEDTDRKYLHNVEGAVIEPGGDVVFVLENDKVVGACALVAEEPGVFELAKMAVDESCRGRGLGNVLMKAVIECAREKGAHRIFLLSNTLLAPAISLYKKFGFKTTHLGPDPRYARADIEMVLDLDGEP